VVKRTPPDFTKQIDEHAQTLAQFAQNCARNGTWSLFETIAKSVVMGSYEAGITLAMTARDVPGFKDATHKPLRDALAPFAKIGQALHEANQKSDQSRLIGASARFLNLEPLTGQDFVKAHIASEAYRDHDKG
jgi:hypothetical protein